MRNHYRLLRHESNSPAFWHYVIAAVVPTLIIGILLILLDMELQQKVVNVEQSDKNLKVITRLQTTSNIIQKIRGMEQLISLNKTEVDKHKVVLRLPSNLKMDDEAIRSARLQQLNKSNFQQKLIALRYDLVNQLTEIIDGRWTSTSDFVAKVEDIKLSSTRLFSQEFAASELANRFDAYTHIVGKLQEIIIKESGNLSNLSNSQENNRNLIELYTYNMPVMVESIGRMRGYGGGIIAKGVYSKTERNQWIVFLGGIEKARENFNHVMNVIIDTDKYKAENLDPIRWEVNNLVDRYITLFNEIIAGNKNNISAFEYFQNGTDVIDKIVRLSEEIEGMLFGIRESSLFKLNTFRVYVQLGGVTGIGILLFFVISFYKNNKSSFWKISNINYSLNQNKEQLRQIIDLIPHMIVARKLDGKILFANQQFLNVFAITDINDLPGEDAPDEVKRSYDRLFSRDGHIDQLGYPYHIVEDNFVDSNGCHNFLFITKQSFGISKDEIPVILTVAMDITDQIKIQELQQVTGIGYWEWDLCSSKLSLSSQFRKIIGSERKDYASTVDEYLEIVAPDDHEKVKKAFESAQKNNNEISLEHKIFLKNGVMRELSLRSKIYRKRYDNTTLLVGTVQDITAEKRAQQRLKESEIRLRELTTHLQAVREEERASIAHDLHDELGSYLTALKMDVSVFNKKYFIDNPEMNLKIAAINQLVDTSIDSMRRIITNLRPSIIDELGLLDALEWQLKDFGKRYDIDVKYKQLCNPQLLQFREQSYAIGIFRIFQELLNNVVRHANADSVNVHVRVINDQFSLSVSDNGRGIKKDQLSKKGSFGILGMHERVNSMEGEILIEGSKYKGTTITLRIPLEISCEENQLVVSS